MTKGTLMFILGAAVGVIGYMIANSPLDPFHDQLVAKQCQEYYSKQLNMTEAEFLQHIQQLKKTSP